jgi:rhomboid protease GluP
MNRRQGPILCGHCHRIMGAADETCPWCGAGRPGPLWRFGSWLRGGLDGDWLVKAIITVNILMFLLSLVLAPQRSGSMMNPFALFSPDQTSLFLLGATGTVPIDRFGRYSSLIAANYLHGGLLHLLFNLMALRQIAIWVTREYGPARMFTIYTLGGALGFYVSYLARIPFTIGASAGLCALIGSLLYYGRSRGGAYGQAVFQEVRGWVIGLFIFGLIFPGINNWGHGGGIVGGILLGLLLGYEERVRENLGQRLLAMVCGVVTMVTLGWGVVEAMLYWLST